MRVCPDDFDQVYVRIGRLACEEWYRVHRRTINRWLKERGKDQLVKARAAQVSKRYELEREKREAARKRLSQPVDDFRLVHPEVVRLAADFLRVKRNGGWMISPTGEGDWWVGGTRRSSAQLVDLAERRGFDRAAADLSVKGQGGVGSER